MLSIVVSLWMLIRCRLENYWIYTSINLFPYFLLFLPESEFNEFEPRLKSAKNRFQLSAGLNLETLNKILCRTNHI